MTATNAGETLSIRGVPVTALESYEHAVECVIQRIRRQEKTFCVAINPEKICRAQWNAELMRLINAANFHICDGVGVTIAAKVLHRKRIGRITGVQFFIDLMARAETEGLKVFLLGASPESNEGACRTLTQKHPDLKIVGRRDGYFKDDQAVIREIQASGADMLFVALGSPKQEFWIAEHRNAIDVPFCMGVGGTFDVVGGFVEWAPKLFRKMGAEWVYRVIREPKRWKRPVVVLPAFCIILLKCLLQRKQSASS